MKLVCDQRNMKAFLFTAVLAAIAVTTVTAESPLIVNDNLIIENAVTFYQNAEKTGDMIYLNGLVAEKCYTKSDFGILFDKEINSLDKKSIR